MESADKLFIDYCHQLGASHFNSWTQKDRDSIAWITLMYLREIAATLRELAHDSTAERL